MPRTLPEWHDCELAVDAGIATPLQQFIYENEPADIPGEERFRAGLLAVLEAALPDDLRQQLINHLFGGYDPNKPTAHELRVRVSALP